MVLRNGILEIPDALKDIYAFDRIIELESLLYEKGIHTLDFSRISFIEPYSMTNLLLIGRRYLKNSGSKLKIINLSQPLLQYLTRMDFFAYPVFEKDRGLDEEKKLNRAAFSKRVIEVTEVPNAERESVQVITRIVSRFRQRAGFILKPWFSNDVVNYFVTVISEVCQNVFEHSMDTGYFALQTYSYNNETVVRLVIADSGIGIEESFSEQQKKQYGHGAELIQSALTRPISGKREFGYGLCRVNSIIREMRGNLFVRSRNSSVAFVYKKGHNESGYSFLKNELSYFDGTQISISLYN